MWDWVLIGVEWRFVSWMMWEIILCEVGGWRGVSETEKERIKERGMTRRRGREGLAGQGKTLKGLGCSRVHTGCRSVVMPLTRDGNGWISIFPAHLFFFLSCFLSFLEIEYVRENADHSLYVRFYFGA